MSWQVVRFSRWILRKGLLVVCLGSVGIFLYTLFCLPDVSGLDRTNPETTSLIEEEKRQARLERRSSDVRWDWVDLEEISPDMVKAVLVSEDDRFFQHRGFASGGDGTITQRLARYLFLSHEETWRNKLEEAMLTWKLEQSLTKSRILEIYLNVIPWGNSCYGVQASSIYYHKKPTSRLKAREAADLVARLSRPHHRSTGPGHQDIRSRSEYLLARMGKADLNLETLPKDIEDNEGIFQVKRKQPSLELPPEKPIVQTASAGTAPDRGSPLLVGAKMVGRSFLDRLSGRTEEIEKTSEPIEPPPKIERTVRPIRPPKPPARSRVVVKTPDPPAPPHVRRHRYLLQYPTRQVTTEPVPDQIPTLGFKRVWHVWKRCGPKSNLAPITFGA